MQELRDLYVSRNPKVYQEIKEVMFRLKGNNEFCNKEKKFIIKVNSGNKFNI